MIKGVGKYSLLDSLGMAAEDINEVRKLSLNQDAGDMKRLDNLLLVPRNQMHRFKDGYSYFLIV